LPVLVAQSVKPLLTSLAVIRSVTRGRAKMQKMVTVSLTQSTDSETDGHAIVITVALRCRKSVDKLTIRGNVSISHAPCLPCHLDLIDTILCSNRCMLRLYRLIAHLIVISRR